MANRPPTITELIHPVRNPGLLPNFVVAVDGIGVGYWLSLGGLPCNVPWLAPLIRLGPGGPVHL